MSASAKTACSVAARSRCASVSGASGARGVSPSRKRRSRRLFTCGGSASRSTQSRPFGSALPYAASPITLPSSAWAVNPSASVTFP